MTDLAAYEWRVGGHGNCAIFAVVGYDRDADKAIGLMNTAELAAAVVGEHNAAIRQGPRLAPNQDAEDVEPVLGLQKGPAPG